MLDKIKITLNEYTFNIILKDCELFGFFKNNNELNKNAFLNTLIVNYYDKFSLNENNLKNSLLSILNDTNIKNNDEILERLLNIIRKNNNIENNDKSKIINLKPTKFSESTISLIENNLSLYSSLSSYYRNMFSSYAQIPLNLRERIVFKDNYELILKSIKEDKQVNITLNNGFVYKNVSVYKICNSKEELFNYVLLQKSDNTFSTLRFANIKFVHILNTKRVVSESTIEIFERQIKCGVEYPFYNLNEEEIVVKLNESGIKMFKKIYLYRPIPFKIINDLYYFNCSYNQIEHYFKRFGSNAIIISPLNLTKNLNKYYFCASKAYYDIIKNNENSAE